MFPCGIRRWQAGSWPSPERLLVTFSLSLTGLKKKWILSFGNVRFIGKILATFSNKNKAKGKEKEILRITFLHQ